MKDRLLRRRLPKLPVWLLVALVAAFAILLGLGALSYINIERQVNATRLVEHTGDVLESLRDISSTIQDIDNSQRSFVLTGADGALQSFNASAEALPQILHKTATLIADNPEQGSHLKRLQSETEVRVKIARARVAQRQELGDGALDPKFINTDAVRRMQTIHAEIEGMNDVEKHLQDRRLVTLNRARVRGLFLQTLGGISSLALLLMVFAGLARQIVRANRAEEETQHSNAQLRNANKEMEAFSYSVAHDLLVPLRSIEKSAEMLARGALEHLPAESRGVLGHITSNSIMMGHLIDDLLSLSKVSYQPLEHVRIDMGALARSAYDELRGTHEGRVIEFEIGELPPTAGDPHLLRQVWVNLIGNALKFTRRADQPRIEIGGNLAGPEFATYFIRDNGAGFDMQQAGRLFGAFQRLHSAEDFEGTGIGLALVQRIVHRHGGTIWAEGELEKGARFAFTLPEYEDES